MIDSKYYEKEPFFVTDDEFAPGCYRIKQNHKVECMLAQGVGPGFYDICQARILGLPYDQYITFCAQNYGGRANKTKNGFISPVIRFGDKALAESLCLLLNKRWKEIFKDV